MTRAALLFSTLAVMLVGAPAQAALIGPTLELPLLSFNSDGTTDYDAGTGAFVIDATTFAFFDGAPHAVTNGDFDIQLTLDASGNLVGGVGGADLIVQGDTMGLSGVLLTGEVVAFGFEEQGLTDAYDFLFEVTGGELVTAGIITTTLVGVVVTSENSSFTGDFGVSFAGEAKGTVGGVIPEPSAKLLFPIGLLIAFLARPSWVVRGARA